MTEFHELTSAVAPGGLLFVCEHDGCGRRLVINRDRGDLVVIEHGDRLAVHRGSVGDVTMSSTRADPS